MVGLKTNCFLLIICITSAVISIGASGDSTTAGNLAENKTKTCTDGLRECGLNCYNPKFKICNKGTVVTCILGLTKCGSGCFNETAGESCNGGVICKKNAKRCGSLCYDLTEEVCLGNNIICPKNNRLCGNIQCYNPLDEICHKLVVTCPIDTELCGVKCYLPEVQDCLGGVVCKKEIEEACGNSCYSPITHSCSQDEILSLKNIVIVTSESPGQLRKEDNDTVVIIAGTPNKGKYFSPYWPVYLLVCMSVFLK